MVTPREVKRVTYSTEIRKLKKVPLNQYQYAISAGSLLGDSCLRPNWSKTNYRFQVFHSVAQKAYLNWKYEALKNLVLTPPQVYEKTNSIWFRTISHPSFSILREKFYADKIKRLPYDIEEIISNPLSFAVWFMDDGNVVKDKDRVYGFHLNTQSFSFEENKIIQNLLKKVWKIRSTIQNNNGYPRTYIGAEDKDKFVEIVSPFIISSMKYKIGA